MKPVGGVMEKKLQDVKREGHFTAAVPVREAIWSQAEGHRHLPTAICPKVIRNLADGWRGLMGQKTAQANMKIERVIYKFECLVLQVESKWMHKNLYLAKAI